MEATVYFTDPTARAGRSLLHKLADLFDRAGGPEIFRAGETVAVKAHFGEDGNTGYLDAAFARTLVKKLKDLKALPFLFDTNTLYRGKRHFTSDHLATGRRHGFTEENIGAPVLIADEFVEAEERVGAGKARVARLARGADALLVISHATGHMVFGYGGAIKNLAMGCASPAGKQVIHSDLKPVVKEERCTGCGTCVEYCPSGAIAKAEGKQGAPVARIDPGLCLGCGECIAACPEGAIPPLWKTDGKPLAEKAAAYARAALSGKKGKVLCLNFLIRITPDCDCCDWTEPPFVPDLGILASRDIVAVDQATVDLIRKAPLLPGCSAVAKKINLSPKRIPPAVASQFSSLPRLPDVFRTLFQADVDFLLEAAERCSLGSRSYRLEQVA